LESMGIYTIACNSITLKNMAIRATPKVFYRCLKVARNTQVAREHLTLRFTTKLRYFLPK
jgi:hypothetical protein